MFSHSSTSARHPGGTTVVESSWSMIAGPSIARARGQVGAHVERRLDGCPVESKWTAREPAAVATAPFSSWRRSCGFGVTPTARRPSR